MSPRAPKRCGRDGCDELMPCPVHVPSKNRRPSGRYGSDHDRERESWIPAVESGTVHCRRGAKCLRYPDTLLIPGKSWHLGHPDAECDAPTAPEHFRCNTSAPGRLRA